MKCRFGEYEISSEPVKEGTQWKPRVWIKFILNPCIRVRPLEWGDCMADRESAVRAGMRRAKEELSGMDAP